MARQKPEEKPPEKLTRREAAARVITEAGDDETTWLTLAKKAEALFVAGGGKADEDRMAYEVWQLLESARDLGYVEMEDADVTVRRKKGGA